MSAPEIVGRLSHESAECGRFILRHADGALSNKFGIWETRETIAAAMARQGLTLRDDDTVVRA